MGEGGYRASVVVPVRNNASGIVRLLKRLKDQRGLDALEVVVVDCESDDGTGEKARGLGATVIEVPRREFDHGATRDLAVKACTHDRILFTVSDAVPLDDDWARHLLGHLDDGTVAGSFGLQVPHPDAPLSAWITCSRMSLGGERPRRRRLESPPRSSRDLARVLGFDNVTSAGRRDLLLATPFGRMTFGEDLVWASRMLEQGYAIVFDPRAKVLHSHDRSFSFECRKALTEAFVRDSIGGYSRPLGNLPALLSYPAMVASFLLGLPPLPDGIQGPVVTLRSTARGYRDLVSRNLGMMGFNGYRWGFRRVGPVSRRLEAVRDSFR